jgi:hypothetical protein
MVVVLLVALTADIGGDVLCVAALDSQIAGDGRRSSSVSGDPLALAF